MRKVQLFFLAFLPLSLPAFAGSGAADRLGPVSLRGYGEISARISYSTARDGSDVSLTRIECESAEKARLLHAKYLSDLFSLFGTERADLLIDGRPVAGVHALDQGWILAGQRGQQVVIVSGTSRAGVGAVADQQVGDPSGWAFTATAEVPAYLDKWDRYGCSFWHRTWATPRGWSMMYKLDKPIEEFEPYDHDWEFRFARDNGVGLLFTVTACQHDRAAGIVDYPYVDWCVQACNRYGIPWQLQTFLGDGDTWLSNRYRAETMQKMPGYVGGYHQVASWYHGGQGMLSWCSRAGQDAALSLLQKAVARYKDDPWLVNYFEPHSEIAHGEYDLLLEYGPLADASYRRFLRGERCLSLDRLNGRWGTNYASWDEVRVPELASFMGWSREAIDLTGAWRVRYAALKEGEEQRLFEAQFDAAEWPEIVAPGHDHQMFIEHKPAWWRREFTVPPDWLAKHKGQRLYLYLWDLNRRAKDRPVVAYLNGQRLGADVRERGYGIAIFEVTEALRQGQNLLAVYLPEGYLAYRAYVAAHEPLQYPHLGRNQNARWVDFRDWVVWTRIEAVRRGLEMFRGLDRDRPIKMLAPDSIVDQAKRLALEYGGYFHNTGYMSAFYADFFPRLMQDVGLPSSAEPGNFPRTLQDMKMFWWRVVMTGLQTYDIFDHIGYVLWNQQIRDWFEHQQPMVHLLGKYHLPETRVAALNGVRAERLRSWPWYRAKRDLMSSGAWGANVTGHLEAPASIITELDVKEGALANYDLVYDEATVIMSKELLARIEHWVRAGGTFVTLVYTGRHSELEPDSWPIGKLTGFDVAWVGKTYPDGHAEPHKLALEEGQDVFDPDYWRPPLDPETFKEVNGPWPGIYGNGIGLVPREPGCEVLMRWVHDGSVAVGRRKLGKGQVIAVGVKFFNDRYWWGNRAHQDKFVNDILHYCNIHSERRAWANGTLISGSTAIHDAPAGRRFLSNNGLYEVYLLCNHAEKQKDMRLSVSAGRTAPPWAFDVQTGQSLNSEAKEERVVFEPVALEPLELRGLLVPRMKVAAAPWQWLRLQCRWWRGGDAAGKVLNADEWPNVENLTPDWAFAPAEGVDLAAVSRVGAGSDGKRMELTAWTYAVPEPVKEGIFRREFTVPKEWTDGQVYLHISSWVGATFVKQGQVWLDGELIRDWNAGSLEQRLTEKLRPGTRHALVLRVRGTPYVGGVRGPAFLEYEPRPQEEISLTGLWATSSDGLRWDKPVRLPGKFKGRMARRTVSIPQDWEGKTVICHALTDGHPVILSMITNGHMIRRHHHIFGTRCDLNIAPFLKFGADNEIEIVANGQGTVKVPEISLRAYPR